MALTGTRPTSGAASAGASTVGAPAGGVLPGASDDAVLLYDMGGAILDANGAACALLGYSRQELLARTMLDLRPNIPPAMLRHTWAALVAHGSARTTARWTRADGRSVEVDVGARLLQHQPVRIEVRARLHSERRAAERARWQRFLVQILDGLPDDGVFVQDLHGRLVYANATAARLFGYPSGEELCAAGATALAERIVLRDVAGRELSREALPAERVLRGEEPGELLLHWQISTASEEHWSLVRSTAVRDAEGYIDVVVTVFRDITAFRQAEERYRTIFESAQEAMFRTTGDGAFAAANASTAALLGYPSAEMLLAEVKDLRDLFVEERRYQDLIAVLAHQGRADEFEAELRRRDSSTCWASLRMHLVQPGNRRAGLQGTAIDNTARRLAERYRYQALHDPLTGLSNRSLFAEHLEQQIRLAQSRRGTLSVLEIDLNGFKAVNDTYGHACGDAVLKQVADRLQRIVRQTDTVARLGGDEFSLLLPGAGEARAVAIAEKLAAAFEEQVVVQEAIVAVRLSTGIAVYPNHGQTSEALMRRADAAMYLAKLDCRSYAVASSSEHATPATCAQTNGAAGPA